VGRVRHHVSSSPVTNGDIGHWRMAGARWRSGASRGGKKAAQILGIHTEVLDIHDANWSPPSPIAARSPAHPRKERRCRARPSANDYHPDHRYTVSSCRTRPTWSACRFFGDVPPLKKTRSFLYYSIASKGRTRFGRTSLSASTTRWRKLAALEVLESQFFEGGADGSIKLIRRTKPAARPGSAKSARDSWTARWGIANKYRDKLIDILRQERGAATQHAEAFENL